MAKKGQSGFCLYTKGAILGVAGKDIPAGVVVEIHDNGKLYPATIGKRTIKKRHKAK